MTADMDGSTAGVDAPAIGMGPLPPEWTVWASAIERREDLRYRVARKPDRVRLTEAVAQHAADGAVADWNEETLDFVAELRAGTDRPELHRPTPRRWSASRNRRPDDSASR